MNWTAPLNPLVTYFHYADWTPATYLLGGLLYHV